MPSLPVIVGLLAKTFKTYTYTLSLSLEILAFDMGLENMCAEPGGGHIGHSLAVQPGARSSPLSTPPLVPPRLQRFFQIGQCSAFHRRGRRTYLYKLGRLLSLSYLDPSHPLRHEILIRFGNARTRTCCERHHDIHVLTRSDLDCCRQELRSVLTFRSRLHRLNTNAIPGC